MFPVVGEEQVAGLVGVGGDAQEEAAQAVEGIEAVALGALNHAVERGGGVSAAVAADEQVVLASKGDGAQGAALGGVEVFGVALNGFSS